MAMLVVPLREQEFPGLFTSLQQAFQNDRDRDGAKSLSTLLTTVVVLLVVGVLLFFAFLFLRQKQHRVYAPRAYLDTLQDHEKTPVPSFGFFKWIRPFADLSNDFVLHHQSLDNYLFIRFFKMVCGVCFAGTIFTWVTLLWVNARGGGGQTGLYRLAINNVENPNWYYAHASVACVFFGFIIFIITKETIYYIHLRQAYYTAPTNLARISPRIVLLTALPQGLRNTREIKAHFPLVKRVWLATECKELANLVEKRDDTAKSLESAEVKLSKIAVKKNLKGEKHHSADPEESQSATAEWVLKKERPTTKTKTLIGKTVDAVEYYRDKLAHMIPLVESEQQKHQVADAPLLPAVFVEFKTQEAAQSIFDTPFWSQPGYVQPSDIGVEGQDDVIWGNLRIGKIEGLARRLLSTAVIVLLILFWSLPIGIVGSFADIDNLSNTVSWLAGLKNLPGPLSGLLSGLLPSLLVSTLLSLVPTICRYFARLGGATTKKQVELKTQAWYFAFQVIQLFLITTFSSGAASVLKQIWEDPSQAARLLAENLPRASTFYLSYFLLQGLVLSASAVFQVVQLAWFSLLSRFLDNTPRKKYERWTTLPGISWGQIYPKITNLVIIAVSYSGIAPLMLGFAAVALFLLYMAFRYNIFYVLSMVVNTNGAAYGQALQQLTVGIYVAELALAGLFAIGGGEGPATIMAVFLVMTVIYHAYMNSMLGPLANTLSFGLADAEGGEVSNSEPHTAEEDELGALKSSGFWRRWVKPAVDWFVAHRQVGGLFSPFLFHGSRSNYSKIRDQVHEAMPEQPPQRVSEDDLRNAYLHPAITARPPKIWLARDDLGVSKEEVKATKDIVDVTDEGAKFDEKGRIVWDVDRLREMPLWQNKIVL